MTQKICDENPTVLIIIVLNRAYLSIFCAMFSEGKSYRAICTDINPCDRL